MVKSKFSMTISSQYETRKLRVMVVGKISEKKMIKALTSFQISFLTIAKKSSKMFPMLVAFFSFRPVWFLLQHL